ncbi:MAG: 1-deoxy-D-xylulose-5-phosphate reductoisomerase [Oscillospiraceae bacterium]|nr:1-deoxy-D-xylulose-5-phosphate reductoisomerase [Oscillospiraceae bacterium]
MNYIKTISVLGSTGSIGTQALEIAKMHNIRVIALAAKSNATLLIEQAKEFDCKYVCIYDEDKLELVKEAFRNTDVLILSGMDGLCKLATLEEVDIVLNSVVGMVGLKPTLSAIEAGKDIALANKETLVAGGELVIKAAKEKGVTIYPVDCEHSAIFQCLRGNDRKQLSKIILTASGGPFYKKTKAELENVSIADALNHPNWSMGKKITIDSATLMNKGLEFIEAIWLFDLKPEQIEILVQRESVIHSAVEYNDHSVIAQLGVPDMKIPIQYALLYPERVECPTKPLSLSDYGTLTFGKPDLETFDCLSACIKAISMGGSMPAMVNGANEEAVAQFLSGNISFLQIGELVMSVTDELPNESINSLEDVLRVDAMAREFVKKKSKM